MLGYAVFLAPQFAITDADIPLHVEVASGSRSRLQGEKIRSETFQSNLKLSLIRTERAAPQEELTPLGAPDAAVPIVIPGVANWEGSLKAHAGSPYYAIEPAPETGPGSPVRQRDSLVGVTAQVNSEIVLVPVQYIMTKFPELGSAR